MVRSVLSSLIATVLGRVESALAFGIVVLRAILYLDLMGDGFFCFVDENASDGAVSAGWQAGNRGRPGAKEEEGREGLLSFRLSLIQLLDCSFFSSPLFVLCIGLRSDRA